MNKESQTQPGHNAQPVTLFAALWRNQRLFIVGYPLFILLPLFCYIIFSCYDDGMYVDYGTVLITYKSRYLVTHGSSGGGGRFSGYSAPGASWEYSIWGKTENGQDCFIDSDDHPGPLNMGFFPYDEGDTIKTPYRAYKDYGEWRWTIDAGFWFSVWIVALIAMPARLFYKYRKKKW